MKPYRYISQEEQQSLLEIVQNLPLRHVCTSGDFFAHKPMQIGNYLARVVKVRPGGFLHEHVDDGPERDIIVLETNDRAITTIGGEPHCLESGGVYRVDPKLLHGSVNHGETDRTHLIVL